MALHHDILGDWKPWFAWKPVRTWNYGWTWMRWVERRSCIINLTDGSDVFWQYRYGEARQ